MTRLGEVGSYSQAAFSPDGSRIAVVKNDLDTDGRDIWTFDIATGKSTAITSDAPPDSAPVWSPDGTQIAYVSDREKTNAIYRRAANGTGAEELVYTHTTGAQHHPHGLVGRWPLHLFLVRRDDVRAAADR